MREARRRTVEFKGRTSGDIAPLGDDAGDSPTSRFREPLDNLGSRPSYNATGDVVPHRIAAVMSTFQPDESVIRNAAAVASQVDHLFVVDDTGGTSSLNALASPSLSVIANRENVGLATSLNRGVESAIAWGATHLLTIDDDTHLPELYVHRLVEALAAARAKGLPVLTAGPRTVNGSLTAYGEVHSFDSEECSLYVMQSGLLFDVEAFRDVGMFRDEFFIDAIEPDFLARSHRLGLHTLLVSGVDLPHSVGIPHVVNLGFRTVTTSNHSAFRMYYFTRNTLTFVRDNQDNDPVVTHRRVPLLRRELVKALVLEPDRRAKLAAVWRGYRAYRARVLGRAAP